MPLSNSVKKSRLIGSVAGLAAFIAFSSKASAATGDEGADTPSGLVKVSDLPGVQSSHMRDDGSVVIAFDDGSIRVLSPGEFVVQGGVVFIDPAAVVETPLAGGVDPAILALGVLGLAGAGVAAISGGGNDGDDAPVLNGAPLFTSAQNVSVAENETATGLGVAASDPEGDAVTFSIIGGDDAARFAIDANSGELSFVDAPDFEAPSDADGDNVFEVQVEATDGNFPVSQLIRVTIDNVNDNAPVIVSAGEVSVRENGTEVITAAAEDADGDALTFSLSGADAALFTIDPATGLIAFINAPDFENPADEGGDNIYNVIVTASDGLNEVTQDLAITVTDQNEVTGTDGNDALAGSADDDVIDALAGDDVISSLEGRDIISTGDGADRLVFAGDPFEGADVSAEGRQIVGGEDFVSDFDAAADSFVFDGADFGVREVNFFALDANADGVEVPAGSNVIVLLSTDNDDNPDTPFLAGTAAATIAALVDEPGPGFFIYHNSNLGLNRLVFSTDLSSADADLKILSRQTAPSGEDAIAALADFSGDNFSVLSSIETGTDDADTIIGTDGEDLILALSGDDIIEGQEARDDITTGDGNDVLVFSGDPFEGNDVSSEGRQFVGNEDFVRDFAIGRALTTIVVNEGVTSQAVVDAADEGNIYFNIHTTTFPAGEVRGNLTLVEDNRDANGVGSVTFSAILNGENEVQDPAVVTDAQGTGTVTFTIAADGSVTYTTNIEITGLDAATLTVGHFHEAPEGANGPVVVDILADARADGSIEGSLLNGDLFQFDAGDLGINGPASFAALDANAEGAGVPAGTNVIVLLSTDNDDNPDTPFLAGTAAAAIAAIVDEPGPGLFIYHNSNLGLNRLVFSTDLSSADADLKILARLTDASGEDGIASLSDFTSENFLFAGDGTAIGTDDDDNLIGTAGDDVIDARAGDDVIHSFEGQDTVTTGEGADVIVFAGDPFEGVDVSAEGRQFVGGEDRITDFDFAADTYQFSADTFGVGTTVNFLALDANAQGAEVPAGTNVIVLLSTDNDDNPDTPFLAGTAAATIAALVDEPGPGFFVYHNSNLGLNRLVFSTDLSSADADLKIVTRQTDLEGPDAIAALTEFSADNFAFEAGPADGVALSDVQEFAPLSVAQELEPFVVDFSTASATGTGSGGDDAVPSVQAANVAGAQLDIASDGLFPAPIDEDEAAAIAQASVDASAGGL